MKSLLRALALGVTALALMVGGAAPSRAHGNPEYLPVSGQVVDASGAPIVGAEVTPGHSAKVATDAQGFFSATVFKLGPDDGGLLVEAAGYQSTYQYPYSVAAGGSSDQGRIALAKTGEAKSFSISGKVADAKGKPAVGARICLAGGGECVATTGADGSYLALVFPESLTYQAISADGESSSVGESLFTQGNLTFSTQFNFTLGATSLDDLQVIISGEESVGKTVQATVFPTDAKVSYQWYANGKVIVGAAGASRRLAGPEAGKKVQVKVTLISTGLVAWSEPAEIGYGYLKEPTPTISGSAKVGKTLKVRTGAWGPAPVKLSFQWYANGRAIKRATGTSLKLKKAFLGKRITVKVTGTKLGYQKWPKVTKATKKVAR